VNACGIAPARLFLFILTKECNDMARIRSGILGNIRGKVAGVVGSQFKDINYVREYVKPANPNSAGQQVQRGLMSGCVAFAKPLVGPVFNEYTDKFQKSMSGFNYFIKRNIKEFVETPDLSNVLMTEGKLSPISALAATYNDSDGELAITWSPNLGNNGIASDTTMWACYDKSTGIWTFPDATPNRGDEGDTEIIAEDLIYSNLNVYAFCAQFVGAILFIISNSVHCVPTEL
jgi:hypothetical protein